MTAVILCDCTSFVILGVEGVFELAYTTNYETILGVTLMIGKYRNRHFRGLFLEVFEEEIAEFTTNGINGRVVKSIVKEIKCLNNLSISASDNSFSSVTAATSGFDFSEGTLDSTYEKERTSHCFPF